MAYLLLAGDFPPQVGGIQSYHIQLAAALTALGREVRVLAYDQPEAEAFDATTPYQVIRVPGGSKKAFYRDLIEAGHRQLDELGEALRGVIATKWFPEGPAAHQFCGQRVPWGVFGHDREFILTGCNVAKWLVQQYVFRHASRCFAISNYAAANFQHRGVTADKLRLVGSAVASEQFGPDPAGAADLRQRLQLNDQPVLLTTARLVPRKGHHFVLQALPAINEAMGQPVAYVVVGDGESRPWLEAEARRLQVADQVHFVGRVPDGQLAAYYTMAEVMVMPSFDLPGKPTEGFGLTYLEANCCGTPVVGTRSGGIADAIDNGVSGLLVPQRQVKPLARALVSLLRDPQWARQLGAEGQQRARQQFRWERVARRGEAAFAELREL